MVTKKPYDWLRRYISSSLLTKSFIEQVCQGSSREGSAGNKHDRWSLEYLISGLLTHAATMEDCQRLLDLFLQLPDDNEELLAPIRYNAKQCAHMAPALHAWLVKAIEQNERLKDDTPLPLLCARWPVLEALVGFCLFLCVVCEIESREREERDWCVCVCVCSVRAW